MRVERGDVFEKSWFPKQRPSHLETNALKIVLKKQRLGNGAVRNSGTDHVAQFVRSILTDNSREHFVALYLDGANQVVSYSIISIGTANMSVVHPREVFQRAILAGAISIVVAHNHPSGILTPSQEDIKVTQRLKDAGEILAIKLLDHLIVSDVARHSIINES